MTPADGLPVLEYTGSDQRIERAVREAQLMTLAEPVAAKKVYGALVEEGRAYAQTEEGRARFDRLLRSPLLARVRAVWEPGTFNLLQAEAPGLLPSGYVDALFDALDAEQLELLLARLTARTSGREGA